jgi:hypothetical protein
MIELHHPELVSPSLIARLNQLIQTGYLQHDETHYHKEEQCTVNSYKLTDPNLNFRINKRDYKELRIVECDHPRYVKLGPAILATDQFNNDRSDIEETSDISVVQFYIASTQLPDTTQDAANQFISSLNQSDNLGWRLPHSIECSYHRDTYGTVYKKGDGLNFWTNDGYWSNDFSLTNISRLPKTAITTAVRCEVLITV